MANHTSLIDFIVLLNQIPFATVGQQHGGLIGEGALRVFLVCAPPLRTHTWHLSSFQYADSCSCLLLFQWEGVLGPRALAWLGNVKVSIIDGAGFFFLSFHLRHVFHFCRLLSSNSCTGCTGTGQPFSKRQYQVWGTSGLIASSPEIVL